MTDSDLPGRASDPTDAAGRSPREPIAPGELDALLAANALDALDADERATLEALLAESPEAETGPNAAGYAEAAARLADAVPPAAPPPSLKASIFDRLDDVPQLSAPVAPATTAASTAPDAPDAPRSPAAEAARRRWFQRPGAILAAAAAVVLLIAGTVVGVNWAGPAGWGAQRDVQAIASATDAETAVVEAAGGGTVELVWSAELGRSAVRADGLPDVGDDSTYELWYIDDSGATPAGTFDPARGGEAFVVLDGDFAPGVIVGITVEPAGGSTAPTTEPIAAFET